MGLLARWPDTLRAHPLPPCAPSSLILTHADQPRMGRISDADELRLLIYFLPFLYLFSSLSAIFLYLPTHHLQCFLRITTHTVQRAWRSSRLPHLPHTVPLIYFSLSKRKGNPAVLDLGEAGFYFDTPFFFTSHVSRWEKRG